MKLRPPVTAPIALCTCIAFLGGILLPVQRAVAGEPVADPARGPTEHIVSDGPAAESAGEPVVTRPSATTAVAQATRDHIAGASSATPEPVTVQSLPLGGGDKTGVSSQAISLPQGAGKLRGMGESFSTDLSTGVASLTVPFALPAARGGAQPSLALHYSSASGHGVAGVGWDVGVPFIARQTDRGLPQYADPAFGGPWAPSQDRFVFNAGQELVPICLVSGTQCSGALAGEVMPPWASGWQYFRARVEGSYLRFFWSPDHRTWRVQSKTGESMELGAPLDGSGDTSGLESDPATPAHVFRWNLVRQYDAYGGANPSGSVAPTPVNLVVYRYLADGAMAYLADVYDTPPAANPSSAPLSAYSHHTHLSYQPRPDATFSYRRGWLVTQAQHLAGVDVTSANFGATGARELLRRYHLAYDPGYHVSLLTSVQMEGRCAQAVAEAGGLLPPTNCPSLPATSFGYQHVTPYHVDGSPGVADLPGYEGFDERLTRMALSPPNSVDEDKTDLFDINSDGLPDVVVTMPGQDSAFPLYLSGVTGARDTFAASRLGVLGVLGATSTGVNLANDNVAACDLDGDGTIDWLHQPAPKSYAIYTPQLVGGSWFMAGRAVPASAYQDPHLDLGEDTPDIDVLDANGDGLVDVVRATGTDMQTFFSLGRYPGGDGNFGSASWTGPSSASLSLQFVASCVPLVAPGVPVRFSDPSIHLGDMNGDGLQDIVYVNQGDIRYWPGRGDGSWGTGPRGSCTDGFAADTYIAMNSSPEYSDPNGSGLRIDDVNGDGLDDLVQVRFDAVDVWLNVDGTGWTPQRHVIQGVQPAQGPLWASKVRLADMNGSGTRDILWGEGGSYRYMDLAGGQRPWVLTHVANGLGKTTDIQYGTSTQQMLADAAAGNPWTSVAPTPIHIVTQVTEQDHLDAVGLPAGVYTTQYSYRDAVYDGRQREFRGFRTARARQLGDANSPASTTATTFLLGECKNDEGLATDPCTPQGRWEDNPREALKGLPLTTETYDDGGIYLSTSHTTYRLRKLYTGLDGREVRVAFSSTGDTYLYDTGPFVAAPATVGRTDVELETTPGTAVPDTTSSLTLRSTAGRVHLARGAQVDAFGNATDAVDAGCGDCGDEVITRHTTPGLPPADQSGWMWRTVESYVLGSATAGTRNDLVMTYDAGGNPTLTQAKLSGTLPLVRSNPSGGGVAPTLPQASQGLTSTAIIGVSLKQYDTLGVLTMESGPNGRCHMITPDVSYEELAVQDAVTVGVATAVPAALSGTCGSTPLNTVGIYDRGLGVVTSVTGPHGEVSLAGYDGFGRVVSITEPDPAGATAAGNLPPSVSIQYILPSDPTVTPYSVVATATQDGADPTVQSYRQSVMAVDGLGRTIGTAQQADPLAGDPKAWIVEGTEYDGKGAPLRAYHPFFADAAPPAMPVNPPGSYVQQRHDAFGRVLQTYGLDGSVTLQSVYHALSTDHWDAADLQPGGQHEGTPATETRDGHGRTIAVTERIRASSGVLESHDTRTAYLPTGEPLVITRVRVGTSTPPIVRWMRYDSLGRMVLNMEPDTTLGFTSNPAADPTTLTGWRYAYDDNGDLVGTSDARGCGANYHYDAAGRILAEDFSPCLASHQTYSTPNLTTGDGTEAFYHYDTVDSTVSGIPGFSINASLTAGRLVSVSDRGARTATRYDARGRAAGVARLIANPSPTDTLSSRYAPTWYVRSVSYDAADRPVTESTGANRTDLLGANGQSAVTTSYSKRGAVESVGSSYGPLVTRVARDADGLVNQVVYGDVASTTSAFSYDLRRRLWSVQTYRGPPATWTQTSAQYAPPPSAGTPATTQLLLEDVDYKYDAVDDPVEIQDWRSPGEWPAGTQPVSRRMVYDDLYRVTRVDYLYPGGKSDPWTSPFDLEINGTPTDTRFATPAPAPGFSSRALAQTAQYDWAGNTTFTDDDAHGFYDRSLGTVSNGVGGAGPYQLTAAHPASGSSSLATIYDAAGNLTGMGVTRTGASCYPSPTPSQCAQTFEYDWDEVGRLARVRRWDAATATASPPTDGSTPRVDLQYVYDASDERVLKIEAIEPPPSTCTPNCNLKACGSDGCSGTCGTCPSGQTCNANSQCVGSCTPSCNLKACGTDGCGGSCGTCPSGQTCNANWQCTTPCTPSCTGKVCGPDGCGGSCGFCAPGQTCNASNNCAVPCTPSCTGKTCGSDGCGGSCGTCASGQTCNASNQCAATCTPSCTGKTCGSDGCGGSCGTCASGQTCNASNQCVATCTPSCAGKACGSDGCGGSCGTCASGSCNSSGQCICTPNCAGKCSGSDGCGGQCPAQCPTGFACDVTGTVCQPLTMLEPGRWGRGLFSRALAAACDLLEGQALAATALAQPMRASGHWKNTSQTFTAYVFDSLELRRTSGGSDYSQTDWTEVPYLFAHGVRLARVHSTYPGNPLLSPTGALFHVLLELPDHLGSSSIVIDRETSEMVERSTYMAYGQPESDYRPARWSSYRDDYKFTGKEEDIQVGLQYFGKRYYSPYLGRWISADPLALHGVGGDPNLYAYVHGRVLRAIDPHGLEEARDAGAGAPSLPVAGAPDTNPPDYDPAADAQATHKMLGQMGAGVTTTADFGSGVLRGAANSVTSTLANVPRTAVNLGRAAAVPAPAGALGVQLPMPALLDRPLSLWERTVQRLELTPPDSTGGQTGSFIGHGLGLLAMTFGPAAVLSGTARGATAADAADGSLAEATAARDALAADLAPLKGRAPATVTGGYNVETGEVAARACGGGKCAEDHVVDALGGAKANVRFTPAIRPRTGAEVPVCPRCETSYGRASFPPGTRFKTDE